MGEGKPADDLAPRAGGDVRAAPLDDPGLHADGLVVVPHGAEPGPARDLQLHDEPEPRARRSSRAPRAAPARRSGGCSAPAGIRSAFVGIPFTYPRGADRGHRRHRLRRARAARRSCRGDRGGEDLRRVPRTSSRRTTRWPSAGGRTSRRTRSACSSTPTQMAGVCKLALRARARPLSSSPSTS